MHRGTCIKCGWDQIIVSRVAEFDGQDQERAMCVTYDPRWLLSSRNPKYGHGVLSLLTCQRCGYSEWYATEPESIPIGPEYKTRLLGAPERDEGEWLHEDSRFKIQDSRFPHAP